MPATAPKLVPLATSEPSLKTLLVQAQLLLADADEANHGGHPITYDLQRQARQVIAAALDQLTPDGDLEPLTRKVLARGLESVLNNAHTDAEFAMAEKLSHALTVHPYHQTEE